MWVVMHVQQFDFEPVPPLPIQLCVNAGKMKGFLPVYETLDDAAEEYPQCEYVQIREVCDA